MNSDRQQELAALIRSGEAMLFTGAGFSTEACCRAGGQLPDSAAMARDLSRILFPSDAPDDSSLADLYDVALTRAGSAARVRREPSQDRRCRAPRDLRRLVLDSTPPASRAATARTSSSSTISARRRSCSSAPSSLWQHVELERRNRRHEGERPRSYLVTPHVTRARRILLESHRIHWVPGTAAEIAGAVL